MTDELHLAGRLALRKRDDMWLAYWAPPDTMEGAVLVATVAACMVADADMWQEFVAFCQGCLSRLLPRLAQQHAVGPLHDYALLWPTDSGHVSRIIPIGRAPQ